MLIKIFERANIYEPRFVGEDEEIGGTQRACNSVKQR